jgi:hypothetical protein
MGSSSLCIAFFKVILLTFGKNLNVGKRTEVQSFLEPKGWLSETENHTSGC